MRCEDKVTGLGETADAGSIACCMSLGKSSFLRLSFLICKMGIPFPPLFTYIAGDNGGSWHPLNTQKKKKLQFSHFLLALPRWVGSLSARPQWQEWPGRVGREVIKGTNKVAQGQSCPCHSLGKARTQCPLSSPLTWPHLLQGFLRLHGLLCKWGTGPRAFCLAQHLPHLQVSQNKGQPLLGTLLPQKCKGGEHQMVSEGGMRCWLHPPWLSCQTHFPASLKASRGQERHCDFPREQAGWLWVSSD